MSSLEEKVISVDLKLELLSKDVKMLQDSNARLIDLVTSHQESLIKMDAANEQKATYTTWLSRNWMAIIALLGIIIELGYQLKKAAP